MNASNSTSSGKSAIVFALDEKFAPLGKGLVLSLRGLGCPMIPRICAWSTSDAVKRRRIG